MQLDQNFLWRDSMIPVCANNRSQVDVLPVPLCVVGDFVQKLSIAKMRFMVKQLANLTCPVGWSEANQGGYDTGDDAQCRPQWCASNNQLVLLLLLSELAEINGMVNEYKR